MKTKYRRSLFLLIESPCPQERVTFRAHQFLSEEVEIYQISSGDIDYPRRLEEFYAKADEKVNRESFQSWFLPLSRTLKY